MAHRPVALALLLAACHGKDAAPPVGPARGGSGAPAGTVVGTSVALTPPRAAAPVGLPTDVKVTLAEVGLEAVSLDRTADPCVDFYQLACGGWLEKTQIPPDRARWARFTEIDEHNKVVLRALLEDDRASLPRAGSAADPAAAKLGAYYASCMDEAAIDKTGISAIKPLLAKTTAVKDAKSWFAALTALHQIGSSVVFGTSAGADLKDSTQNVLYLDASGLGLPDRDYYVKPELKDKVDAYRTHVGKMLALAGTPPAKVDAAAADVLAIETELAKLTKTGVERRDVQAAYNPTDAKGLAKQVKSIDWAAYWKALDVRPSKLLVVGTPAYFAKLDALRTKLTPAQWASYFTYHLVSATAFSLGKPFDDEDLELQKVLTGVTARPERFKRCITATTDALGELLGAQYVAKAFPATSKAAAIQLIDAIVAAMGGNFGELDWMSAGSKKLAAEKLGKLVRMIGYPDTWKTYELDVKPDDFAGNELRAGAFNYHRVVARAGTPVDRSEWGMNAFDVNAYYRPSANNTALPAGILQPPFFGPERGVAANLGGIGMVIGHELTHGFDDQGAQFDAAGNLKNWWSPEDKAKFEAKGTCVADQYSTFEALPKQFVNGRLTLGEDIADLGGVKTAFHAYRALRQSPANTYVADGFTEDQQFFLAVGQAWCSKDRPAEVQRRLTVDPHAPPKFRVYGALRNLPEFADAFHCAAGTPMHPANTCQVW